ncbi:hypothetical protein [Actinomadura opuntiae]|uniref:hypothetical protein n=1 Tax=Actinomadura sp. OS1-43 TaxID=604315 RepID=UPI00255AD004|nr:hypothetical protein [Actinomadura sp. OS1-43]MDL4812778.1 hypothetical protein [Actinomadura sp. OS1-43]
MKANPITAINAELVNDESADAVITAQARLGDRVLAYAVPCEDETGKVVGWQIWNAVTEEEAGGASFIAGWRGYYGWAGLLPTLRRYALKIALNRGFIAA